MRLPTFKTPCFHLVSFIPTAETLAHLVWRGARWANTCCFVSAGAFECMKAERGSARERNKVNNNQINPQFLCQHLSFTALPLPPPHLPSTPERNKWMNNYRYKHLRAIQRVFFLPLLIFFLTLPPLQIVFWTVSLQVPSQPATSKPVGRWEGSYGHLYFNLSPSSSPPSIALSLPLQPFLYKNLFICLHPNLFRSWAHIFHWLWSPWD